MPCYQEAQSEERLREQVDSMRLSVSLGSDAETDAGEWTEQIAALHVEVLTSTKEVTFLSTFVCLFAS